MKIPLCKPYLGKEEIEAVNEVLKSGWLADGPKNKEFEKEFASYIGTKKATSLNSCTSALQLAIEALGINGEIIVPSFTFSASANSIVKSGAKPVFVDVEYGACNMDPKKVAEKITKKTQAIMPVHFAGQACNMKELMEIAEKNSLKVIEDSAETIGGTFNNKKTGSFGIGCFSFYPTKNLTTGEGGMVTSNDEKLIEDIKVLKSHGMSKTTFAREKAEKPWLRASIKAGYNFRLCDLLAVIGLVQLKKVDKMNDLRRQHALYLNKNLDFDGIDLPVEKKECRHVYQMYTIKLRGIDRTNFIKMLRDNGIGASVHFDPPVHLQPYYLDSGWKKEDLAVTEQLSKSIVTLPMYPSLTKEELDFMIEKIEEAIKNSKR